MNLIETIFASIKEALNKTEFEMETGKDSNDIEKHNWVIGSGSNFQLYLGITYAEALRIYKNLGVRQCCGKQYTKMNVGYNHLESYACMESNSGEVYLFLIKASEKITDNRKKPNPTKKAYEKWKKERKPLEIK